MLSTRLYLSTLLAISFTSAQASGPSQSGSDGNTTCTLTAHNTSVLAYVDWPFRIDCEHLRNVWKAKSPNSDDELECRLQRNEIRQTNNIFTIANFDENRTFIADLYVNNTRCLTSHVQIDLLPFPNETCQISRDDSPRLIDQRIVFGDQIKLYCGISNGEYPAVIPKGADKTDFKTVWITSNCKEKRYRTNNMWENIDGPKGFGDTLHMPTVDFYDAVNFTCSVAYKGKALYPVSYQMCMSQQTMEQNPSLTCVKSYNVVKNGYVSFDCSGQMTGGMTQPGDFRMLWKKGDKVICKNDNFDNTTVGIDGRFSCIADDQTDNEPFQCIYYKRNVEIQGRRKHIKLSLSIKDVQSDDFGSYTAIFMALQNGEWKHEPWTITVTEDRTPYFQMLVRVLSAVLVVIIALTVVAFLVWKYRIYFLVLYKRSRLWKYDNDDKEYVAYLSYHFDNDDKSERAQTCAKYTESIVTSIHDYMESNKFRFYDEQRDADFGAEVEKVTNLVEKSHRMILVLTTKYLEDRWLRFQAELGFHGLLESGLGLVLIVTPGVEKLLDKKANDKVWSKLRIVLTTNRVIKWTEGMSDDVLKKHLEYGMPKLKTDKPTALEQGGGGGFNAQFSDILDNENKNGRDWIV